MRSLSAALALVFAMPAFAADPPKPPVQESAAGITHSLLVTGGETYIIGDDNSIAWRWPGSTRDGWVLAIATEGDTELAGKADEVIYLPVTDPLLTPILAAIPMQLLSYHIATRRGCDVDQPRNLAKSVTVE